LEQKRRGKVIFRSGSLALKIIVAVLILFSMAALAALRWVHTGIQARTGELRDEAAALEQQSRDLEEKIEDLGSVKSVGWLTPIPLFWIYSRSPDPINSLTENTWRNHSILWS